MPFHVVWPRGHTELLTLDEYRERAVFLHKARVSLAVPNGKTVKLDAPTDLERTAWQLVHALRLDVVHFSDAHGCAVSGCVGGIDFECKRSTPTEGVWGVLQMHEDECIGEDN